MPEPTQFNNPSAPREKKENVHASRSSGAQETGAYKRWMSTGRALLSSWGGWSVQWDSQGGLESKPVPGMPGFAFMFEAS